MSWDDWQYHPLKRFNDEQRTVYAEEAEPPAVDVLRILVNDDEEGTDSDSIERYCRRYLRAGEAGGEGCPTDRKVYVYFTAQFDMAREVQQPAYRARFPFDAVIQDIIRDVSGEQEGARNIGVNRFGTPGHRPPLLVLTKDVAYAVRARADRVNRRFFAIGKDVEPEKTAEDQAEILGFFRQAEEHRNLANDPLLAEYSAVIGHHMLQRIREFIGYLDDDPDNRTPVVILGQSGTGKEAVARLIHGNDWGELDPGYERFQSVLVGAIAPGTLQGDLFGVTRLGPADTESSGAKPVKGLIEKAERGTLFIDEVGDLPLDVQGMLMRFLQEKEIQPIGGDTRRVQGVRCVFATNADLRNPSERPMREDFIHRIDGLTVDLPPLYERGDDHPQLIDHFLAKWGAAEKSTCDDPLTAEVWEKLLRACADKNGFTGNVRQLASFLKRLVLLMPVGRQVDNRVLKLALEHSLRPPRIEV